MSVVLRVHSFVAQTTKVAIPITHSRITSQAPLIWPSHILHNTLMIKSRINMPLPLGLGDHRIK